MTSWSRRYSGWRRPRWPGQRSCPGYIRLVTRTGYWGGAPRWPGLARTPPDANLTHRAAAADIGEPDAQPVVGARKEQVEERAVRAGLRLVESGRALRPRLDRQLPVTGQPGRPGEPGQRRRRCGLRAGTSDRAAPGLRQVPGLHRRCTQRLPFRKLIAPPGDAGRACRPHGIGLGGRLCSQA